MKAAYRHRGPGRRDGAPSSRPREAFGSPPGPLRTPNLRVVGYKGADVLIVEDLDDGAWTGRSLDGA